MSKPAKDPTQTAEFIPGAGDNPDTTGQNSTLNSPKIGDDGQPTQRAITSAKQAHAIAKNLKDRAKLGRIKTAAVIAEKYNGGAPFNEGDLARTGQSWRNNFSTNWLASIIDRVKPQMLDPVNKADVLTHSVLPASADNGASKSRKFCEVTTRVIRNWPAWRTFASQLAQENTLFGLATPAWIDSPTEWRPHLWAFDQAYLPEGTGQHASMVQVAAFGQKMLLNEFITLFRDKRIAERNCYNVENCIKAANSTTSQGNTSEADETLLQKEDRIREGGQISSSYENKARTVDLYHVIVCDWTGQVDLWTVTQDEGLEIRCIEGMHEDMTDALTLFTFQGGNDKLYGSKGLGRLLANLHIAIERGRCLGADQMYLSGLVIFQADKMNDASLQAKVRHPFIFLPRDLTLVAETIKFEQEAFMAMDGMLSKIGESIAGAFIPPDLDGEGANTKIEAAQNAERQLAVKEGVLGRFFDQLADLVSAMQRKIYCDINLREGKRAYDKKVERQKRGIVVLARRVWKLLKSAFGAENKTEPDLPSAVVADEESVTAIIELLESGLTVEDIATLALSPSAQSNATDGASRDSATMAYIAQNVQNPFIDQKAATLMGATIAIGDDRAKQLIVPTEDPNVIAIATRQQLIEVSEMLDGVPMPVAGTDNHKIHRAVIAGKMDGIMQSIATAPTPAILATAELMIGHYIEHINQDPLLPPEQKGDEAKAVEGDLQVIEKTKAMLAKQAAIAAGQGTAGPAGMPVPVAGQPPQVGANGQVVGEDPNARQSIHPDDAQLKLEIHRLGQEDQRIQLEREAQGLEASKIAHQQQVDGIKLHQKNVEIMQKTGQDVQGATQQNADRELQASIEAQKAAAQQQEMQLQAASDSEDPAV